MEKAANKAVANSNGGAVFYYSKALTLNSSRAAKPEKCHDRKAIHTAARIPLNPSCDVFAQWTTACLFSCAPSAPGAGSQRASPTSPNNISNCVALIVPRQSPRLPLLKSLFQQHLDLASIDEQKHIYPVEPELSVCPTKRERQNIRKTHPRCSSLFLFK